MDAPGISSTSHSVIPPALRLPLPEEFFRFCFWFICLAFLFYAMAWTISGMRVPLSVGDGLSRPGGERRTPSLRYLSFQKKRHQVSSTRRSSSRRTSSYDTESTASTMKTSDNVLVPGIHSDISTSTEESPQVDNEDVPQVQSASLVGDFNNSNPNADIMTRVVKVADFGVARVQTQSGVMTAETGTYRWMAPEGLRLTIPKNTHPKLVDLLERCWQQDPTLRPDFSEIIDILQKIAKEADNEGGDQPNENPTKDWSVLLAAITAMVLAAEKQLINFDWKPKRPDMLMETFGLGRIVHDGFVFRQNFPIRSYEIGADRTASIETLMNHLQETSLNHVKRAGLLGDGFGSTPEMSKRGLIWVVTRMQIVVDRYPSWGDIVEVDTWVGSSGKNGMRRDWCVRDCNTRETVARATSVWVMMNKGTRKLSKMPDEVRGEIGPYFFETAPIIDEDGGKLPKLDDTTADGVRTGLMPRWYDLDVNQHVNNVKYINWILESAPISILESYELASMTLEYRRECVRNSIVQSLTSLSDKETPSSGLVCTHLLRLEDGAELVRGRTQWRPKHKGPH